MRLYSHSVPHLRQQLYTQPRAPQERPNIPSEAAEATNGPPPEYGLRSMLKDFGSRLAFAFKRLFGLNN